MRRSVQTLGAVLLCLAALQVIAGWRRVDGRQALGEVGPRLSANYSKLFEGVVLAAHHKTGTTLASCLLDAFAWHIGLTQGRNIPHLRIEESLTSSALSYYLDTAKYTAQREGGPAAAPPYMLLTATNGPPAEEVCFDTAVMYFDSQVRWHNGEDPGQLCPQACPCHAGNTDCLGLGSCHLNNAHASLFWVHLVQDPTDAVLVQYHSHMKYSEPLPHDLWMTEVTAAQYARRLRAQGIPHNLLRDMRLPMDTNVSLWHHLRALPEAQGLVLEYLHMSTALWRMARMYQQVHRLNKTALIIRQEDLEADPLATVAKLAEATGLSTSQQSMEMAEYVHGKCRGLVETSQLEFALFQPPALGGAVGTRSNQVSRALRLHPRGRGQRYARRERLLMGNTIVFEQLCRLSHLLGYATGNNACQRQALSILYS